jgi:type VI secretion system lysozyme-like protein
LLFERLVEPTRSSKETRPGRADPGPPRLYDADDLRASIGRELSQLLNTRAPVPIDTLERRTRSAIDYGIPDLSAFPIGEQGAMVRLERHIREAILAYEPRLRDPVVQIERSTQAAGVLTAVVRGVPEAGTMRGMPVTFELLLGPPSADTDAG